MRYEGQFTVVQEIEKEIKRSAKCYEHKNPRRSEQPWYKEPKHNKQFQLENSSLKGKVIDVITLDTFFSVSFLYNERDNNALVDIRDRDISWLCKISPRILKLLAQLEPQKYHKSLQSQSQNLQEQLEPQTFNKLNSEEARAQ